MEVLWILHLDNYTMNNALRIILIKQLVSGVELVNGSILTDDNNQSRLRH